MTRFWNLDLNEKAKVTNEQTLKNLELLKGMNAKFYIHKGIFNYSISGKDEKATRTIENLNDVYSEIEKF